MTAPLDVLVVGGGIAGLTAALHAHEAGHRVQLLVKDELGDGATALAQGGIAGLYGDDDSPAAHAADTLTAGAGLSDPAVVDVLVGEAAARIAELVTRGVPFDRSPEGALLRGLEAAHSRARIAHAGGDATGAAISAALADRVRAAGIPVRESAVLADLMVRDGGVRGACVLAQGRIQELLADAVILATGGAGRLFAHTTAPTVCTGDGIAAAMRAGAAVADLEFVQFHPTVLAAAGPAFLISEAVRGEGAVLLDDEGRRFAFDAHPDGELAPRDVVARAIMRRDALQGAPVRLDATGIGAERLARRFPTIDRVTRERGFDWARTPIPVTPAAHYLMGGVVTDAEGRTTVPGLFAVGECARTGVHGANRLASNSLLEGAVFGARAAAALSSPWPSAPVAASASDARPAHRISSARSDRLSDQAGGAGGLEPENTLPFTRPALQQLMWDLVGPLRTVEGLTAALHTVRRWAAEDVALADRDRADVGSLASSSPQPPASRTTIEDRNLLDVAEAMVRAALARRESVGAHHIEGSALPRPAQHPALIGAR